MRPVYQAEHVIDAYLIRGRLQAEGIPAYVQGEYLTGALGELPASGLLAVCVRERDIDTALALLAQWQPGVEASSDQAAALDTTSATVGWLA